MFGFMLVMSTTIWKDLTSSDFLAAPGCFLGGRHDEAGVLMGSKLLAQPHVKML